jgi:hypothetical protein
MTIRYSSLTIVAIVCLLTTLYSCSEHPNGSAYTFNRDIAPIIHKNCTPCHRPGESAPFSLITYKDVRKKAKTIVKVTGKGLMPPWPADPSYQHYAGERFLSAEEKQMLADWVEQGSEEGDPAMKPKPPFFPEGSQLGTPDLVIPIKEPFMIPGDNRDRFMVIKIPFELPADTFVRFIEYVPGNRNLTHHVNGHVVQFESGAKKDVFAGPWFVDREVAGSLDSCYRYLQILNDDGTYPLLTPSAFNFLPGMNPQLYPEGIGGFSFKKKGVFLMRDLHYGPSPKQEEDSPRINIFFSKNPPKRPFMETQLGTLGISEIIPPLLIPPDTVMKFVTRAKIMHDISLVTINPHMHLLGKSFLAYAITPAGDTIPLVRIKEWDFRWQFYYTFRKMLHIPAGSTIVAEGVFDNTASNPNNPFTPPREITGLFGSMKTTDEMFQLIMTFLPYQTGDENISLENVSLDAAGL